MFIWYCFALNFKSSLDIREKNNYTLKSVLQQRPYSRSNFCFIFKKQLRSGKKKKNHSSVKECLAGWIARLSSLNESMMSHLNSRVILLLDFRYEWAFTAGVLTQDDSLWLSILERKEVREGFKSKQVQHPHCEWRLTICYIQTQLFLMNCFVFTVPARIVNISQDKSVNEGDDVNLFCLAIGRPEPTITWKDLKCEPHLLKPGFHGHLTITSRVITAVTRTIIISICHRTLRRCHNDHCNSNNHVCH